ncbi:MAG: rod shape-determining protein MreD [Candidatus Omnitrophica bacterium]|nr:rod shape-determining protein MreD [Candidatus Omnitrophota bacterium]
MVKRTVTLIIIILLFAFFEINFPRFLRFLGVTPNLLLISVVFFNLYFKQKNALLFTGFCGAIKDVFSIIRFGTNVVSFTICGFTVNKIKTSIDHDDRIYQVLIVFLISLLNSFIFYLLNLFSMNPPFFKSLFFIMLPEALYTAIISPIIFQLLKLCALKYSV